MVSERPELEVGARRPSVKGRAREKVMGKKVRWQERTCAQCGVDGAGGAAEGAVKMIGVVAGGGFRARGREGLGLGPRLGRRLLWEGRRCCFRRVWGEERGGSPDSC